MRLAHFGTEAFIFGVHKRFVAGASRESVEPVIRIERDYAFAEVAETGFIAYCQIGGKGK